MDDKATAAKIADDHYEESSGRHERLTSAIVAALEAARRDVTDAAKGSIIDCTGEVPCVRRVLGDLPLTEDGAVVATGGLVYFIAHHGTGLMRATADDVRKGWVRSPECWADEEAARGAMARLAGMEGRG